MSQQKRYAVYTFYVAQQCECGGDIDIDASSGIMTLSLPPQKAYQCNKCDKIYNLSEKDWPHMEMEKQAVVPFSLE